MKKCHFILKKKNTTHYILSSPPFHFRFIPVGGEEMYRRKQQSKTSRFKTFFFFAVDYNSLCLQSTHRGKWFENRRIT